MRSAVASSWASFSVSPSRRNITRARSGCASQLGRGKLPMVVAVIDGSCIFYLRENSLQATQAAAERQVEFNGEWRKARSQVSQLEAGTNYFVCTVGVS